MLPIVQRIGWLAFSINVYEQTAIGTYTTTNSIIANILKVQLPQVEDITNTAA